MSIQRVYQEPADLVPRENEAQVALGDPWIAPQPPTPQGCEPGGGLSRLITLLEPRRPCDKARLAQQDGVVTLRREQDCWLIQVTGAAGEQVIRVQEHYTAAVSDGDHVRAGDALTQGTRCHLDLLRVLGPDRYGEHVERELEMVFALTGAPPDNRALALVVRELVGRQGRSGS